MSRLRALLICDVMLRCSLADKCVYFRGRILPVSVMNLLISCGLVNGICWGVRVCVAGFGSVLLMIKKGSRKVGIPPFTVNGHF